VIGPVLLGMGKSVHVLQAGDEVRKIVRMAAMAVLDAQIRDGSAPSSEARSRVMS
jgi:malate dehydrogenase (oxaloacetate-decarboxylating)(NADP+)